MLTLIGALVIGLTLGMLGSGGSAITVPILIYMVGHGTKESIAESMAIVGLISVAAAIPYARAKQIDWRSVWYFGIPGMFGTLIGAWLGGIASETLQLVVFGGVLVAAAYSMIGATKTNSETDQPASQPASPIWKIAAEGIVVGIVTGFVGVGGGFLIVPALVVLGRLPMRLAIGTSLVIISIKAAVGFAKYEHFLLAHDLSVDPRTILVFTMIGVVGSLIGRTINRRMNQRVLKQVFAGFLVLLGGFVIINEGKKMLSPREKPAAASDAARDTSTRSELAQELARQSPLQERLAASSHRGPDAIPQRSLTRVGNRLGVDRFGYPGLRGEMDSQ